MTEKQIVEVVKKLIGKRVYMLAIRAAQGCVVIMDRRGKDKRVVKYEDLHKVRIYKNSVSFDYTETWGNGQRVEVHALMRR